MTGGEIVVECLKKQGVNVVFGMPGTHLSQIYAGLYKNQDSISHILARHEGGASLMAEGYSRAMGEVGVCLVIPGPGASNAYTGIVEAYTACSPVLLITGQHEPRYANRDYGKMFHGLNHIAAFSPITKLTKHVEKVEDIPDAIDEVFTTLRSGRPKPVLLEITANALSAEADLEIPERNDGVKVKADKQQLQQAVDLIVKAERRFIIAGKGVYHARDNGELLQFAKLIKAPVATTAMGKGVISEYEDVSIGGIGNSAARNAMAESDLVLAIGTRFTQMDTAGWSMEFSQPLIHIEADPEEINKEYTADVGIAGDATLVLRQLMDALKKQELRDGWGDKISKFKNEVESAEKPRMIRELREILSPDATLVSDVHIAGYPARTHFKVYDPSNYLYSGILVNMGYGLPAAIGAKVAHPNRQVVAFCGDGGFILSSPEFATAMKYNLKILAIVVNDNALGSVKGGQVRNLGGSIGVDLYNPDFVKYAESFGAYGFRVNDPDDFKPTIEKALTLDKPALVEVVRK
ncbi:MAG: thiamine pyrophosphate-binding protein [Candidatus Poribacteria bacterium]